MAFKISYLINYIICPVCVYSNNKRDETLHTILSHRWQKSNFIVLTILKKCYIINISGNSAIIIALCIVAQGKVIRRIVKFLRKINPRAICFLLVIAAVSLFCLPALALNIIHTDLELYNKTNLVTANQNESFDGNEITPGIVFSEVGDFVTYKLSFSDVDNSEYRISHISDNNENENIKTSYYYDDTNDGSDDKDVYITLTYAKELTSDLSFSDFQLSVNLEEKTEQDDEVDIMVPDTGRPFTNKNETTTNTTSLVGIILVTNIVALLSLYIFLRLQHKKRFSLPSSHNSRLAIKTAIIISSMGLAVTGGTLYFAQAINSDSVQISFRVSKVKVDVEPSATYRAQFVNNANNVVTNIDAESKSCNTYFDHISCEIVLPNFSVAQGFDLVGWSTDKNSIEAQYLPGETIALSNNTTLYTITHGKHFVTFNNQHETYFTTTSSSEFCDIYNNETECSIMTPTATKNKTTSRAEFLGWDTNMNATEPTVRTAEVITISEDVTFYSVASVPRTTITAVFVNNDENGIAAITNETKTCTMVDDETSCNITMPDFSVASGYEKIGWNTNRNAMVAEYMPGQEISLSQGTTLYTISRKRLTASFINNHTAYFTASGSSASCFVYNGANNCSINAPTVTKQSTDDKIVFRGWNTNASATTGVNPGGSINISSDSNYYSIAKVPIATYSLNFENDMWLDDAPRSYFSNIKTTEVSRSCTVYTGETSCIVQAPSFDAAPGWSAYGYDTKHPMSFYYEDDKTENFVEIGDNITMTSANDGRTYYTVIRKTTPFTISFENRHTTYLTASSSSETCYPIDGRDDCKIKTPNLVPKASGSDASELGWATGIGDINHRIDPDQYIIVRNNAQYYSVAFGIAYTITFDKNTTHLYGSEINTQLYAADSLSLYTIKCVVRDGGCYLPKIPRIYASGRVPTGFSLERDLYQTQLTNYSFTEDTTVYARITDWDKDWDITFSVADTRNISTDDGGKYQIDFEDGIDSALIQAYDDHINAVFANVPQFRMLHGKMRIEEKDNYVIRHSPETAGLTSTNYGIFSPITIKSRDDEMRPYDKAVVIHELGHALSSAYGEFTNSKSISSQSAWIDLYNTYKELYDGGESYPLRSYAYNTAGEFFAEAITFLYQDKIAGANFGSSYNTGYITPDITEAVQGYICQGVFSAYSSSPICQ